MTAMLYGFIGAHRTGKTTLAREVAEKLGVPFYETSVSQTIASLGLTSQEDLPFKRRLEVQNAVLDGLLSNYAAARAKYPNEKLVIVDRTPLDVLGYTYSEILRASMTPELDAELDRHEKACFAAANFNFIGGCLVQPGIVMVADATKATPNVFYQRHVNATMLQAANDERNEVSVLILGTRNVALKSRVADSAKHCESIISRSAHKYAHGQNTGSLN